MPVDVATAVGRGATRCPKCKHGLADHSDNHGDFNDCSGMPRSGWKCRCEVDRETIIWAHADALDAENATLRAENARLTLAAKNVLLAFHDWPTHDSTFANGERRRALDNLTAVLLPPEDSTDGR